MKILVKEEIQSQIKQNMPEYYPVFKNDIENFLNGKKTIEDIERRVNDLLINMEISTCPAFGSEITQAKKEIKGMLKVIGLEINF